MERSKPILHREIAPCTVGCPAGIDIPRYIGLVALGKFSEATAVVRERIPFPSVCGYICYRPCEPVCRRGLWEAPVAINAIKDAAARRDTEVWRKLWKGTIAKPTGKRVAVVGSGPAGLTAAYYLGKRCGHDVTIFEAQPRPGGQLRIGVPPNRLPRDVIDREIAGICETRVEIRCNHKIENLEELFEQGYNAVFLALGTCIPVSLEVPGEDLPGVWKGVYFLKEANLGFESHRLPAVGKRVAIIGAGNVAVDCARTALRLGAGQVRILYRRTRREMPAYDFEMRAAEIEGAQVEFLVSPTGIEKCDDGSLQLRLTRMELAELDASGRPAPRPIPGSESEISADAVMIAIGQIPGLSGKWRLELKPDGTVAVEEGTLKTSRPGVFAGGDVVLGPHNIIEAIAQGRKAAQEIDRFLGGRGDIGEVLAPECGEEMEYPDIHPHGKHCVPMSELPVEKRTKSFETALGGYTAEQAMNEALRCVRCDLWSLKGVPKVWWERRGLEPYWLGGKDRRSREKDRQAAQLYGPYEIRYQHAPYIPEEYVCQEEE